jgi:uncharacterized protein
MEHVRQLQQEDFELFDNFLAPLTDTSMFMRSNVRRGGFTLDPQRGFSGSYYGYFSDGELRGVLGLSWNGSLLSQVPDLKLIAPLLAFIRDQNPSFAMHRILGPSAQVLHLLEVLSEKNMDIKNQVSLNSEEASYGLSLHNLVAPESLTSAHVRCRPAATDDLATLIPWRQAYNLETYQTKKDEKETYQETISIIHHQNVFVLEVENRLVARADFNATVLDVVQMGGVWTPPHLRCHGYGRAVVAGALLEAQRRGATYATLFTHNPFAATCYESLGFQSRGTYHILLFKKGLGL